jgi:arginine/lysine/ornithine decarboxylase
MDKRRAPLFESLLKHRERSAAGFHVPGHKSGKGIDPQAAAWLGNVCAVDLTELTGLDDLHHPEGVIREAERLAAACFGAEETFFLVGGSTVGNLALLLTVCEPGDLIVVQRNAHKSVIHGLMLAGARAVFVHPRRDRESGLATGIDPAAVERALEQYPEAKAVFITNPNYYGMGVDVAAVAEAAHARGKPLLVDEAHGAHFGFHPEVPPSAMSCGADAAVQSTHKMLTAMTMGAMLHVQGPRIDRDALRVRLAMLQTSSPSYPIMASLDLARRQMDTEGRAFLERGLAAVARFDRGLRERPWFGRIGASPSAAYVTSDPFKRAVFDATGTLTGFELMRALERHGVFAEMADSRHVLFAFSPASDIRDADVLLDALDRVRGEYGLERPAARLAAEPADDDDWPRPDDISAPVRFGLLAAGRTPAVESVPLERAAGRLAAEIVVPYPPGIPLLYPGEPIDARTVERLARLAGYGAKFQGAADAKLRSIRVFRQDGLR